MSSTTSEKLSTGSLIFVPFLISMAITALRLVGELQHWPTVLFNPSAGGGGAIVGITWLAPVFGIYFAIKLSGAGEGPDGAGKAIALGVGSVVVLFAGVMLFAPRPKPLFPGALPVGLVIVVVAGILPAAGWRRLFSVLLAYGYSVRIPVAILMYFAIRGNWGTHYDVVPPSFPANVSFWPKYIQIGVLPQLIFWVAFTIVSGSLFGSVVAAVVHRRKSPEPQPV